MHHCYSHLSPSAPCLLSLFLIATRDIVNKALGDIAKIKISTSSSNQLPMMLLVGVKLDFKMTSSFGWLKCINYHNKTQALMKDA